MSHHWAIGDLQWVRPYNRFKCDTYCWSAGHKYVNSKAVSASRSRCLVDLTVKMAAKRQKVSKLRVLLRMKGLVLFSCFLQSQDYYLLAWSVYVKIVNKTAETRDTKSILAEHAIWTGFLVSYNNKSIANWSMKTLYSVSRKLVIGRGCERSKRSQRLTAFSESWIRRFLSSKMACTRFTNCINRAIAVIVLFISGKGLSMV